MRLPHTKWLETAPSNPHRTELSPATKLLEHLGKFNEKGQNMVWEKRRNKTTEKRRHLSEKRQERRRSTMAELLLVLDKAEGYILKELLPMETPYWSQGKV